MHMIRGDPRVRVLDRKNEDDEFTDRGADASTGEGSEICRWDLEDFGALYPHCYL